MQASVITQREAKIVWRRHHHPVSCKHSTLLRSMTYLLFAHSTNTPHTRHTRWTVNNWTHILSGIKWRFKGELRCNGGNNEQHHHTRAHIVSVGRRCIVPNNVSRTKVNLVTAMFVYWHDTAADFTTHGDGLDGDGVLGVGYNRISRARWMANTNDKRVRVSSGWWMVEWALPVFLLRRNWKCFSRTLSEHIWLTFLCRSFQKHMHNRCSYLMASADCHKVANTLENAVWRPEGSPVQFGKVNINTDGGNVLISFNLVQSESMNNINLKLVDEGKIASLSADRERVRGIFTFCQINADHFLFDRCEAQFCQNICICRNENLRIRCVFCMQKICQPLTIPAVPLTFNGRMYSAQKATS